MRGAYRPSQSDADQSSKRRISQDRSTEHSRRHSLKYPPPPTSHNNNNNNNNPKTMNHKTFRQILQFLHQRHMKIFFSVSVNLSAMWSSPFILTHIELKKKNETTFIGLKCRVTKIRCEESTLTDSIRDW